MAYSHSGAAAALAVAHTYIHIHREGEIALRIFVVVNQPVMDRIVPKVAVDTIRGPRAILSLYLSPSLVRLYRNFRLRFRDTDSPAVGALAA